MSPGAKVQGRQNEGLQNFHKGKNYSVDYVNYL